MTNLPPSFMPRADESKATATVVCECDECLFALTVVERCEAACARAEHEYPLLAAPDGTVAISFTDLRALLNLVK